MEKNETPTWQIVVERLARSISKNIGNTEMLDLLASLKGSSANKYKESKDE